MSERVVYGHRDGGFAAEWMCRVVPERRGIFRRRDGWRVELWNSFASWTLYARLGWHAEKAGALQEANRVLDEIESPDKEWV